MLILSSQDITVKPWFLTLLWVSSSSYDCYSSNLQVPLRIADNFHGVKILFFRGQTDLDENFPHKNLGVFYRNEFNARNEANEYLL